MKIFFRTRKLAREFATGTKHQLTDGLTMPDKAFMPKGKRWYVQIKKAS